MEDCDDVPWLFRQTDKPLLEALTSVMVCLASVLLRYQDPVMEDCDDVPWLALFQQTDKPLFEALTSVMVCLTPVLLRESGLNRNSFSQHNKECWSQNVEGISPDFLKKHTRDPALMYDCVQGVGLQGVASEYSPWPGVTERLKAQVKAKEKHDSRGCQNRSEDTFHGLTFLPCPHRMHHQCALHMIRKGLPFCHRCWLPLFKTPALD